MVNTIKTNGEILWKYSKIEFTLLSEETRIPDIKVSNNINSVKDKEKILIKGKLKLLSIFIKIRNAITKDIKESTL